MNKYLQILFFLILSLAIFGFFFLIRLQSAELQTIKLYYYNDQKDVDAEGNILCSQQGLETVDRSVSSDDASIEAVLNLLLEGELSSEEKVRGLSTEFPLPGLKLVSTDLDEGVLTLTFEDSQNKTSGGSCRAAILWHQIEATAKQFPEVEVVRFEPEWLFQP